MREAGAQAELPTDVVRPYSTTRQLITAYRNAAIMSAPVRCVVVEVALLGLAGRGVPYVSGHAARYTWAGSTSR